MIRLPQGMACATTDVKSIPKVGMTLAGFGMVGFLFLVLAACVEKKAAFAPPTAVPDKFSTSGEQALSEHWWLDFGDPELNALIERAFSKNPGIRASWARLDQVLALERIQDASLFPSVEGFADASRILRRDESNALGARQTTRTTDLGLGLSAAYEVDLWNRLGYASAAASQDRLASVEDLKAAYISLAANSAKVWYQLVEANALVDVLENQLKTNQQVLDLVTARFRRGQVGATDVLRQRQLVEASHGDIARTKARIGVAEHALAILLGDQPESWKPPRVASLIRLPPLPDTGLPVELVFRRPDIQREWNQAAAADSRISSAIANKYPRLSLSARVDTSGPQVSDLFRNWFASLAANLVGPIFEHGKRQAEVERSQAVLMERLSDLEATILDSLAEVEDALVREHYQDQLIESLERQFQMAAQIIESSKTRYLKGTDDYLRILDSLTTHQNLERTLLSARRERIENRIDLCRALAGGWSPERPPTFALGGAGNPGSGELSQ